MNPFIVIIFSVFFNIVGAHSTLFSKVRQFKWWWTKSGMIGRPSKDGSFYLDSKKTLLIIIISVSVTNKDGWSGAWSGHLSVMVELLQGGQEHGTAQPPGQSFLFKCLKVGNLHSTTD